MDKIKIEKIKEGLHNILYSYMFELSNDYTYNDLNDKIDKYLLEAMRNRIIQKYDYKFNKITNELTVKLDIKNEKLNFIVSIRGM